LPFAGAPAKEGIIMARKKMRKTARMRASRKHKARKKQERKSGHKRVRGTRKRK